MQFKQLVQKESFSSDQEFNDIILEENIEAELNLHEDLHEDKQCNKSQFQSVMFSYLESLSEQNMSTLLLRMDNQKNKIVKIQSFCRMYLCKKKFTILRKWSRYRKFVLQELIDSEFTYIKDLEMLITTVYDPLKDVLTEQELYSIFRNLLQIYSLNKKFLYEISEMFSSYNPYTCFGKIFEKYVQFFKIYYEYTSGFSIEIVTKMREKNSIIDEFISQLEEDDLFRGCNLEAFLIKPVQRLPKYVLLLKDLIKHTWKGHPDFENLQNSLGKFIEVNKKIDILMDDVLKNQMLFELQQQFFDIIHVSIVESTRKYILSETLSVLKSKQIKSVILYICNDMLILTQRNQNILIKGHEKLDTFLYLDENSYCKDKTDGGKYCKYIFTVCTQNRSVTFLCLDSDQKLKLLQLIEKLIQEISIRKESSSQSFSSFQFLPVRVFTKNTELVKSFFSSYTIYNLIITVGNTNLLISTRYSNLIKLQQLIRKEYPNVSIPYLSKNNWLYNKKTKLIEARKIILENFIEGILNSPQIRQAPSKVLKFLNIQEELFELLTPIDNQEQSQIRWTNKSQSFNIDDELERAVSLEMNTYIKQRQAIHKSFTIVNHINKAKTEPRVFQWTKEYLDINKKNDIKPSEFTQYN